MSVSVNYHCVVCLSLGPHDGQYLRMDPAEKQVNWQGEAYSHIPGKPAHALFHVRSAVIQIVNETQVNLRQEYQKFCCWFFQIPHKTKIKEHIATSGIDRRLIALFNALVVLGLPAYEVFPELQDKH